MTNACILRSLEGQDANEVRKWLADWLEHHLAGWVKAYGLDWTEDKIRMHIFDENLVDRDWYEISEAASDPSRLVRVAEVNNSAAGIIYAELRPDRYLSVTQGVISWLYVTPEARGQQVASNLLENAHHWMREQQVVVSEVFVTATNHAALETYNRAGYQLVDHRLVVLFDFSDAKAL